MGSDRWGREARRLRPGCLRLLIPGLNKTGPRRVVEIPGRDPEVASFNREPTANRPLNIFPEFWILRRRRTLRRRGRASATSAASVLSLLVGALLALAAPASAQETASQRLRVFLDCQTRCDRTYIRTEITFVDWMRDRADSQVHVLITSQGTGGGGDEFLLEFIGTNGLTGQNQVLRYISNRTDTSDEIRGGLTRTLAIGLANYAAMLGRADRLDVAVAEEAMAYEPGQELPGGPEDDPWHLWVFNVRGSGSLDGETRESAWRVSGGASANRTTEIWKGRLSADGRYNHEEFELSDSTRYVNITRDWSTSGLVAYALAPHWSIGLTGRVGSTTRFNQDLSGSLAPGIEYSYYPYEEATRRQISVFYQVGMVHYRYEEETIYDKMEETLPEHELSINVDYQQPWGEAGGRLSASQYLHDLSKYEAGARLEIDYRIIRGLSLNIEAGASLVENQLYLPKGDLTDEEILLRRRAQETDFRYGASIGFRYSFGSIYNNVVNNRYDRRWW
jgi:hypothetical protein